MKMTMTILLVLLLFACAFAQVTWLETTQADFADGFADQNLYISHRTNVETVAGAIEWYARFDLDGNGYCDFASADEWTSWPFSHYLRIWLVNSSGYTEQTFDICDSSG